MNTLLKINASLFSANGQSSQLTERFAAAWQASHPGSRVVERDLAANPVPHLDGARFMAFLAKPEERSAEQQAVVDFSDALIAELRAADAVVIGLPMYNFGIPSQLKAYFDHIARAGVTFRYTANGPEGLVRGKRVIVAATYGGRHPVESGRNFVEPYLRQVFGFLGIDAVEFVSAEALNVSPEQRTQALENAQAAIDALPARAA